MTQAALANMSQTVDTALRQVGQTYDYEWSYLKESTIDLAVLTTFFGLFTILTAVAAYVLFSKDITRKASVLMFVAILIMWASTAAYWIVTLVVTGRVFSGLYGLTSQSFGGVADMQACLVSSWTYDNAFGSCPLQVPDTVAFFHEMYWLRDCTETASLAIGVVIGDAIVWWRAWVLWPHSRAVRSLCVLLILLTTVTGILDAWYACTPARAVAGPAAKLDGTYLLLSGDIWGIVACFLSFLTNLIATALIAFRAWQHRRSIMSYLREASPRTQVERTLALLVESGLLYCALWVVISVYALSDIFPNLKLVVFAEGFTYVMRGCLGTLIGMYPTLIIIVCAVDKSLHQESACDAAQLPSMRFDARLTSRRGTLPELMSVTSTRTVVDASGISVDPFDNVPSQRPTGTVEACLTIGPLDKTEEMAGAAGLTRAVEGP